MIFRLIKSSLHSRVLLRNMCIIGLLGAALLTSAPLVSQYLIDHVIPSVSISLLIKFFIFYFIYELIMLFLKYYNGGIKIYVKKYIDFSLLHQYFHRLVSGSLSSLSEFSKGELLDRVNDAQQISAFYQEFVSVFINNLAISLLCLIIIFLLSGTAGFILTFGIALYIIMFFVLSPYIQKYEEERFAARVSLMTGTDESIRAIETMRAFKIEEIVFNKIISKVNTYLNIENQILKVQLNVNGTAIIIHSSVIIAIKISIILMIFTKNDYTIGQMLSIFILGETAFSLVGQLLLSCMKLKRQLVIMRRYYKFCDSLTSDKQNKEFPVFEENIHSFEISNLTYSTPSGKKIFSIPGFSSRPGDVVKISGKNGTGKTSLCRILCGLTKGEGEVKINGYTSDAMGPSLFSRVALTSTNDLLFEDTVLFNIALGKPLSIEEIVRVAKLIGIDHILSALPDKYHTVVNSEYVVFSEGEKQKILFMRMYFSNADVLIFDEIFRGMDVDSVPAVEKIMANMKNKIIFIVSHQKSVCLDYTIECNLDIENSTPNKQSADQLENLDI